MKLKNKKRLVRYVMTDMALTATRKALLEIRDRDSREYDHDMAEMRSADWKAATDALDLVATHLESMDQQLANLEKSNDTP